MSTIDFKALLTDEYLAVANRGRPFTREGLRAVCQAHISPKDGNRRPGEIKDEDDAAELVGKIQQQRRQAYENCPDDLAEHLGTERTLRKEYKGHILRELIQNAHDALAETPIGQKGVGFKAVLNISEGPRIHSGHLHCGFDRQRSKELLQGVGLFYDDNSVPLLRLPHLWNPENEPPPVRNLIEKEKYDTVIVLPFANGGYEHIESEWEEYANDAKLLLFLAGLRHIVWQRQDKNESSTRTWHRGDYDGQVEILRCVETAGVVNEDIVERWRLWQSAYASVALGLDASGAPVVDSKYPNIRVFFETEEKSPLPFLIHARFPLREGRDHILIDDETSSVAREVAELVQEALSKVQDAGLLLDFLRPRTEMEAMGKLERKLWDEMFARIIVLEIPGTSGLRLRQVRLRPSEWSGPISIRVDNDPCSLWNNFKGILSRHRPGGLSGLPFLPPGVDTLDREETILHFHSNARLLIEELRGLPLLPVVGPEVGNIQIFRPAHAHIFFPPKESLPPVPNGIEIRFLTLDFARDVKKEKKNLLPLLKRLNVCEFNVDKLIEKAILPSLQKDTQPDGLLEFLCQLVTPNLEENDLVFDWRKPVCKGLAERLLIPTRQGDKRPAMQVYAGIEWTGYDFLDRIYGECPDRGFLGRPPAKEEDKQRMEKFYRWIGVGWYPKVLPIVCHEDKPKTHEGLWLGYGPPGLLPDWQEYMQTISSDDFRKRKTRVRQNWTLDGSGDVLLQEGVLSIIGENWKQYKQYKDAVGYQSRNVSRDFDDRKWTGESYLIWLFRKNPWIPTKRASVKRRPKEVFFADSEVVRSLNGWVHALDTNEGADNGFLKEIGVRSDWEQLQDEDWKYWLRKAGELSPADVNEKQAQKDAVHTLYREALRHWKTSFWQGAVWGVERLSDNTEKWELKPDREDIYFVDRPDLAELRLNGLWIFPEQLNGFHKQAGKRFGIRLLSEYLSGEPEPSKRRDRPTASVRQKIEQRGDAIKACLEVENRQRTIRSEEKTSYFIRQHQEDNIGSDPLDIDIPTVNVVDPLKIKFKLDCQPLPDAVRLESYPSQTNDDWTLWLDACLFDGTEKPKPIVWEAVARAIVYANPKKLLPNDRSWLRNVLSCEDENLSRELLNLGVTQGTVDRMSPRKISAPLDAQMLPSLETPMTIESQPTMTNSLQHPHLNYGEEPITIPQSENRQSPEQSPEFAVPAQYNEGDSPRLDNRPQQSEDSRTFVPQETPFIVSPTDRSRQAGMTSIHRSNRGSNAGGRSTGQAGRDAQEWLRDRLRERLAREGWNVSNSATREEGRETDIKLGHYQYGTFHVEVKHRENDVVYWSENEVSLAKHNTGHYFMVVLVRSNGEENYQEYWILDPLNRMQDLSRTGVWEWRGREDGVDLSGPTLSWTIPSPRPKRDAARFSFKMKISIDWLKQHCVQQFDRVRTYMTSQPPVSAPQGNDQETLTDP